MPCERRGGIVVCSREPQKRCHICDRPTVALCDATKKDGTPCDAPMCEKHRYRVGEDTDVCKYHNSQKYIKSALENRRKMEEKKVIKSRRTWIDEATGESLTYEIDVLEGFKEFKENEEFREFARTGNFIHCENRFVINHPKYVKAKQGGGVELTDYARANEKECCIVFKLVSKDIG